MILIHKKEPRAKSFEIFSSHTDSTPEPLDGIWPPFFVGDDRFIAQIVLSGSDAEPPGEEIGEFPSVPHPFLRANTQMNWAICLIPHLPGLHLMNLQLPTSSRGGLFMVNIRRVNHPSFSFFPVAVVMQSQMNATILRDRCATWQD